MIITKKHLSRRKVLRGLGAVVALPWLDSMVPALTALDKSGALPARRLGVQRPVLSCARRCSPRGRSPFARAVEVRWNFTGDIGIGPRTRRGHADALRPAS